MEICRADPGRRLSSAQAHGRGPRAAEQSLSSFDHDGLVFDYLDVGPRRGEPVVLLHGFPADRRCWDAMVPPLVDAGYRVLAPDQRGYSPGARPRGRRAYALHHTVGDVVALADAVGLGRFHLVGHDWGGAVAWAVAAAHGDRLASLTSLTTPHLRALLLAMVCGTQALRSWYMLWFQLPWWPEAVLRNRLGGATVVRMLVASGLSRSLAEEYLGLLRAGAATPAINWYRALPFNRPHPLANVSVPTLYVWASADAYLGRRAAYLTGRYVRGPYCFEVLDGASHWVPEEHAERTVPLLLRHLLVNPVVAR